MEVSKKRRHKIEKKEKKRKKEDLQKNKLTRYFFKNQKDAKKREDTGIEYKRDVKHNSK